LPSGAPQEKKNGRTSVLPFQVSKVAREGYSGEIVAPIAKVVQPPAGAATAVPEVSFMTTFVWSLQNVLWPVDAAVMGVATAEKVPLGVAMLAAPGEV
jgi:hypothetical protein